MKRVAALLACAAGALALTGCNNDQVTFKPIPPKAVITGTANWSPLDTAEFDGSLSSPADQIVDYAWSIVKRPDGSMSQAQPTADPKKARFWIDVSGDYTIELKVTDQRGMSGVADFDFAAVPWQAVHVEMTWDKADTDVDLHLVSFDEGGQFFQKPYDCYFDDPDPDWGETAYPGDDPSLDRDDTDGYGPEHVSLAKPLDAHHYKVVAHYYDDRGHGSTNVTVRIYLSGQLRYEGIEPLARAGSGWDVATIDWPSGAITSSGGTFTFAPPD